MYLSIIVPVFNEKDNISILVKEIYEKLHNIKFEIIIVENGSTDLTYQIGQKISGSYSEVKILTSLFSIFSFGLSKN